VTEITETKEETTQEFEDESKKEFNDESNEEDSAELTESGDDNSNNSGESSDSGDENSGDDTKAQSDDDFIMMTTVKPTIWVLSHDGTPIATSFDKTKLNAPLEAKIREITVSFNEIGVVRVNQSDDGAKHVLTVQSNNLVFSVDRVIGILDVNEVNCI
jgi:hypothetical protein